jgi:hypothetical protein
MSSGTRLRLVPCDAEPRHWKVYGYWTPERDYEPPCMYCAYSDATRAHEGSEHSHHGRWRRWKATGKVSLWMYSMGITAGGGTRWGAGCDGCVTSFHFRGKRIYVLGIRASSWGCLLRQHHLPSADKIAFGFCSKCLPCADCGPPEPFHRCEVVAA